MTTVGTLGSGFDGPAIVRAAEDAITLLTVLMFSLT